MDFLTPKEVEPFFCYICGGPSTSARLIKASQHDESEEESDSDEMMKETDEFYQDDCDCRARGHPACAHTAIDYKQI